MPLLLSILRTCIHHFDALLEQSVDCPTIKGCSYVQSPQKLTRSVRSASMINIATLPNGIINLLQASNFNWTFKL